jgi:hypothetical protein
MIISVLLIAFGTAVAAYGEVALSVVGLLLMFSSETFEAIRLVMTQVSKSVRVGEKASECCCTFNCEWLRKPANASLLCCML